MFGLSAAMSSVITPDLARLALEAKAQARRNQTRRNLSLLAGIVLGILATLTYVIGVSSQEATSATYILGVAVGATAAGLFLLTYSSKVTPDLAKCPSCNRSWEIEEGRSVPYSERMTSWDKCPGCALPMRTELLQRIVQSG